MTGRLLLDVLSRWPNGLITGNWRKFQVRAVCVHVSLSGRTSQGTKRMLLVVSDGHMSVSPHQSKLAHTC